jgi:hypothetical protein
LIQHSVRANRRIWEFAATLWTFNHDDRLQYTLVTKDFPMQTTRRRFLRATAATAFLGRADLTSLGGLAAIGAEQPATALDMIRFGPDLEPLIRLIEETPRDQCVVKLVEQLRRGLPYRRLLSAVFFAAIRRKDSNFHEVYKIHSAYQVSLDLPSDERILPLFWAVDGVKRMHEDFPSPPVVELQGTLPCFESAAAEFDDAIERADRELAERALVVMARGQGARQIMEQLWIHGAANVSANGHRAIAVASCWRTLETIGWQHAEPVLRFVVQNLFSLGGGKPDQYYQPNTARVDQHLDKLPPGWAAGLGDREATIELFALLRDGKSDQACALACEQLLRGIGAQAIWDSVHLAAAELMIRGDTGFMLWSRPLHANTSANALHYAFRTSTSARTRLLVLLQAVAWVAHITSGDLRDGSLRDLQITELHGTQVPASSEDAVAEVFSLLPFRTYHWDSKTKHAETTYGSREGADLAGRKVFALAHERPEAVPLVLCAARNWLCLKATVDAHDYKFLAAILENVEWVSPRWQPHLLAASVHDFHGEQSPDSPVVKQARQALESKG